MAELLIKAVDHNHPDPEKDRTGAYKRGMIVEVREDGAPRGNLETFPKFVWILVPGISKDKVLKYVQPETTGTGENIQIYRRRLWQIRWADLPQAAKDKLQAGQDLIIKAGSYDGPFDYTWTQVKQYFRNLNTGLDETEEV